MATVAAPGARDLSPLHPFLQSTTVDFERVVRAAYWLVADMDWRHTSYWRDQLDTAERMFMFSAQIRDANESPDLKEQRDRLQRQLLLRAVSVGFENASRRPYRLPVPIPDRK